MSINRFNALPLPRFGQDQPARKTVLFSTDIDGTLMTKGNYGMLRTARLLEKEGDEVKLHLTTGRGLTFFKQVAPRLKRFHVKYLSVNNGEQLYINTTDKPADQWIMGLTHADRCMAWDKAIQQRSNWTLQQARQAMSEILQKEGFTPPVLAGGRLCQTRKLGKAGTVSFETLSDQSAFRLSNQHGTAPPALKRYGTKLNKQFVQRLAQQGIQSYYKAVNHHVSSFSYMLYSLLPGNTDKSSVIPFLLEQNPDIQAVISAGNEHYNDREFLGPHAYTTSDGRAVPNHPIVVGDEEKLLKHLKRHPRLDHVPTGRIFWGIWHQLTKIRQKP